jgi:hypothetical protein
MRHRFKLTACVAIRNGGLSLLYFRFQKLVSHDQRFHGAADIAAASRDGLVGRLFPISAAIARLDCRGFALMASAASTLSEGFIQARSATSLEAYTAPEECLPHDSHRSF